MKEFIFWNSKLAVSRATSFLQYGYATLTTTCGIFVQQQILLDSDFEFGGDDQAFRDVARSLGSGALNYLQYIFQPAPGHLLPIPRVIFSQISSANDARIALLVFGTLPGFSALVACIFLLRKLTVVLRVSPLFASPLIILFANSYHTRHHFVESAQITVALDRFIIPIYLATILLVMEEDEQPRFPRRYFWLFILTGVVFVESRQFLAVTLPILLVSLWGRLRRKVLLRQFFVAFAVIIASRTVLTLLGVLFGNPITEYFRNPDYVTAYQSEGFGQNLARAVSGASFHVSGFWLGIRDTWEANDFSAIYWMLCFVLAWISSVFGTLLFFRSSTDQEEVRTRRLQLALTLWFGSVATSGLVTIVLRQDGWDWAAPRYFASLGASTAVLAIVLLARLHPWQYLTTRLVLVVVTLCAVTLSNRDLADFIQTEVSFRASILYSLGIVFFMAIFLALEIGSWLQSRSINATRHAQTNVTI